MNITEHLLFKVAEECAETAQRASKAARFGMEQVQRHLDDKSWQNPDLLTNRQRLYEEFIDLCATMQMLDFVLPDIHNAGDLIILQERHQRIVKYLDFSREHGTLTD